MKAPVFTKPALAVAKYCNKHVCIYIIYMCVCVCLSVCLSASISPEPRAIFTKFLCILPFALAQSSSGGVTQFKGDVAILRVFFSLSMHCAA